MKYYDVAPLTASNLWLSKYVAEYEQMWKRMVEFLKFQCRCIKIDNVNSIRVAKSMIFFTILRDVAR